MCALASSGYLPPGTYAPTASIGTFFCPSFTPGSVSISNSPSEANCASAILRT